MLSLRNRLYLVMVRVIHIFFPNTVSFSIFKCYVFNLARFHVLRHHDTYLDIKCLFSSGKLSWHIINWTFFNVETVRINHKYIHGYDTCLPSTKKKKTLGIRADLKSSLKTLKYLDLNGKSPQGKGIPRTMTRKRKSSLRGCGRRIVRGDDPGVQVLLKVVPRFRWFFRP